MICQYANLRIEMRKNMLYNDINTGKHLVSFKSVV